MGGDKPPPPPPRSAVPLGAVQAGGGAETQAASPLAPAGGLPKRNAGPSADEREAPARDSAPGAGEQQPPPGGEGEREGAPAPPQPPPPKSWSRGKAGRPLQKGGGEAAAAPPSSCGAGKGRALAGGGGGGGYWKEGCLQSELIQFHLRKGLAAAQMQSKGSNQNNGGASAAEQPQRASPSSSSPSPMAPAGAEEGNGRDGAPEGASSLNPRQQQELQEEVEKLREENETLKVRRRGVGRTQRVWLSQGRGGRARPLCSPGGRGGERGRLVCEGTSL